MCVLSSAACESVFEQRDSVAPSALALAPVQTCEEHARPPPRSRTGLTLTQKIWMTYLPLGLTSRVRNSFSMAPGCSATAASAEDDMMGMTRVIGKVMTRHRPCCRCRHGALNHDVTAWSLDSG